MAVLRRRGRQNEPEGAPAGLDLDAVTEAVLDAAAGDRGDRPELAEGPTPVLGFGPDAYSLRLAADDGPWAGPLVARAAPDDVVAREAGWIEAVRAAGFPAPEPVTPAPAGRVFVFRAPEGKTLAESMLSDMSALPKLLAAFGELHARLHALPADVAGPGGPGATSPLDELAALAEGGTDGAADAPEATDGIDATDATSAVLADERAWLDRHRPPTRGQVVCHGELNPAQVYLDDGDLATAVPVNWTQARRADAELDVAATLVAFWTVPLYLDNAMYRRAFKMARDSLVSGYLSGYEGAAPQPPDDAALRYWQAFHVCRLAAHVARRLDGAPPGFWDPATNVAQPAGALRELRERFWELAGA